MRPSWASISDRDAASEQDFLGFEAKVAGIRFSGLIAQVGALIRTLVAYM
jgi:hypothetical protein